VRPAFEYPFIEAGREVLVGIIPAWNRRSLTMAKRLGLRETHRIRDGFDRGVDLVVLEIRKNECRWLDRGERKAA
jgi:RimJ/RimL family protein N-acetyltransferase